MRNFAFFIVFASFIASTSAMADAPPPVRTHLGLTIADPPAERTQNTRGRISCGFEGSLRADEARVWVGAPVPAHVPAGFDNLELFDLIPTRDGHLAIYRDMFGHGDTPGCSANAPWENCTWLGRFYTNDGEQRNQINFNGFMHRADHLRVGDVAIVDDIVFFNLACQTYAANANKECSAVHALRMSATSLDVLWKSKYLASNTQLLAVGDFLITGYGFTDEKDFIHVIAQKDGKIVQKIPVKKAPEKFELNEDVLAVWLYDAEEPIRFSVKGFTPGTDAKGRKTNARPKLTRLR